MSVLHWDPQETAFAVVDIETTGFSPGHDRVVELSVVRIGADGQIKLVLDTLVNPDRPIDGTAIHGIHVGDIAGAPKFDDVAGRFLRALEAAVMVGHNVEFDHRFLRWELARLGWTFEVPYIDTMNLGPVLHLCERESLDEACALADVQRMDRKHSAAVDAIDTAKLFVAYKRTMKRLGISSFGALFADCKAGFVQSLQCDPVVPGTALPWADTVPTESRFEHRGQSEIDLAYRTYFNALLEVLVDLDVSDSDADLLAVLRERLHLSDDYIYALHAQAFAGAIMQFVMDKKLDQAERAYLCRLRGCLERAGWAPGS